jgi:spermidine dehydrogenase
MSRRSDRELGMHRPIRRRDFLNGVALAGGALAGCALAPGSAAGRAFAALAAEPGEDAYPPALTGMRGSGYPSAYATGHAMRDGTFWSSAPPAVESGERYDLIVVGAGISGLTAAYLFQKQHGFGKKVLVLDNHDDFGGHAKRNEFRSGRDLRLSNAGSFNIYAGSDSSRMQREVYRDLGIDVAALARDTVDPHFYARLGMGQGVFFDQATFGADRLLKDPAPWTDFTYLYAPNSPPDAEERWRAFMAEAPLAENVKRDLYRLYHERKDYLPGLSLAQKIDKLTYMSYQDYLLQVVGCDPGVCTYLRDRTYGSGRGLSSTTALSAHERFGLPGFAGLGLPPAAADQGVEYHFPDGNATVARLLVRSLVPGILAGRTAEDSVLAHLDYAYLDRPGNGTRIRLNSTVVHALNRTARGGGAEVAVSYMRGGELVTTVGAQCVLACWNYLIPYLCPEMPLWQREALSYQVHTPNLWVNVWLRQWRPFHDAGVNFINAPGSYFASLILEQPVTVGGYRHSQTPDDPVVMTMLRGYETPGLPIKDQFRLGRAEMYATTFETFERNTREQLGRTLGAHGFDPARDIAGLTVNRWGHGYAYWYSPLYDEFLKTGGEPPHLRARQPFGNITIANTASGADDSTELAIDMAARAVNELALL